VGASCAHLRAQKTTRACALDAEEGEPSIGGHDEEKSDGRGGG
jgi:hypothetical protein